MNESLDPNTVAAKPSQAQELSPARDGLLSKLASQVPGILYQFQRRANGSYCFPYTSRNIQEIFGVTLSDLCYDAAPVFKAILPEDQAKVMQSIEASAQNLTPWECEYRVQLPGQPIRWLWGRSTPEKLADGSILWHGYNSDITKRKQVELSLQESEARLVQAQAVAQVGNWEYDMITKIMWASEEAFRIYGFERTSPYLPLSEVQQRVVEEDRPRLDTALRALLHNQGKYDEEFRIVRLNDQAVRVIHSVAHVVCDGLGKPCKVVGVLQDITNGKKAAQALQQSESLLRTVVDNIPFEFWARDTEGRCIMENAALRQHWGSLLGQRPEDAGVSPEELAIWLDNNRRAVTGELVQGEVQYVVNGQNRIYQNIIAPIRVGQEIRGSLGFNIDITEGKQAGEALRRNEARQGKMVANIGDVIVIIDQRGINRYKSPNLEKWFGWRPEEVVGADALDNVHPEDLNSARTFLGALFGEPNATGTTECRYRCKDGTYKWIEFTGVNLLHDPDIQGLLGNYHDITERKQAEADKEKLQTQLFQAQKIEGIGQLAGGVAHDFNNILASMLMNLELLHQNPHLDADAGTLVKDLEKEAHRAATLTRQLLAFSRRSIMQVRVVDLNDLLGNLMKMLRRLIGENITIETGGSGADLWIEADAGMIEQVILNLTVNARDAMPKGGRLSLRTTRLEIPQNRGKENPEARPGKFVCLMVTDTGGGMDAATVKRIFEPFFTTKEVGKGTGLGLATVHGIVKQHNGWVEVESAVGQGSTFRVYLPASAKGPETVDPGLREKTLGQESEVILLVEDEPSVRKFTSRFLTRSGYTVLEAENGREALKLWELNQLRIHLLYTDMIMPEGMTGLELAERLRAKKSGLPVIVASGYSTELAQQDGKTGDDIVYVPKPCAPSVMLKIVRDCLGKKGPS